VAALEDLVRDVVRSREDELRELVRQAVDEELARLAGELVERELQLRQNGGGGAAHRRVPVASPPTPEPESPATRRCYRCGETKPTADFVAGTTECRSCKRERSRAARQRRREATPEPEPG
jgi:hypothetical protein